VRDVLFPLPRHDFLLLCGSSLYIHGDLTSGNSYIVNGKENKKQEKQKQERLRSQELSSNSIIPQQKEASHQGDWWRLKPTSEVVPHFASEFAH